MSVDQIIEPDHRPRAGRLVVLIMLGLGLIGLQIALPWGSMWINRRPNPDALSNIWDESSFWQRRFRFEQFLDPGLSLSTLKTYLRVASAAVCGDEFVILLKSARYELNVAHDDQWKDPSQLLRIHLRSGRVVRSQPPPETRHVLSDGEALWYLPAYAPHVHPFLWNGRPTVLQTIIAGETRLCQIYECTEGKWQATDRFVLLPAPVDEIQVDDRNGEIHVVTKRSVNELWYRTGLETGGEEEAREFRDRARKRRFDFEAEMKDTGWTQVDLSIHFGKEGRRPRQLGWFVESGSYGEFFHSVQEKAPYQSKLVQRYYPPHPTAGETLLTSPVKWPNSIELDLVNSADGTRYLMHSSIVDGRIHILRLEHDRLALVGQCSSPLIWLVGLDGGLFFALAWGIPMLVWAGCAWMIEWRYGKRHFASGLSTVRLASAPRRGLARLIDLTVVSLPLLLSVACDPDVVGWWISVTETCARVVPALRTPISGWNLLLVQALASDLSQALLVFLQAPRIWWLFWPGVAIFVLQILWQARTGQTLGKRLLGIRVVRTTLQPCGLARSVLREIWLMVDSLMLCSFVPGVVAMLTTQRSQRLGDKFADTIVIVDSRAGNAALAPERPAS